MKELKGNPFFQDPEYYKPSYGQEPTVMSNLAIAWEVRKLREAVEQLSEQPVTVAVDSKNIAKAVSYAQHQFGRL